jgi:hypothetical protein
MSDTCPPDGTADKYVLHRLPPAKAVKFQLHIRKCHRCNRAVELARTIVRTLRAAEPGMQVVKPTRKARRYSPRPSRRGK